MGRIGVFWISVFAMLVTSAAAQSVQSGSLHRGVIYDQTGAPIPGVVVTFEHPQQGARRVAVTDLWGEYAMNHLEPGTRYTISISHPGFEKRRLRAAAADHINVTLRPRRSSRIVAEQALIVASR